MSTRQWRTFSNVCHKWRPQIQHRNLSKFDAFGDLPVPANKQRFVPSHGTYPQGFLVGSINAGIKPATKHQHDLILVASEHNCCGAAVFTKNEFPAASIPVTREIVRRTKGHGVRSIIANSWCANTLTGQKGLEDTTLMGRKAAEQLHNDSRTYQDESALVMHTGVGGQRLPIDNIVRSLPKLQHSMGNSHQHWINAAWGIATTDTFPKLTSRTFTLPSAPEVTYNIAGITKGAGMIHPNMATTLGIICTDAAIAPSALQKLLASATDKSYNCISVEGDTSTNDMVAMLANGAAGGTEITFHTDAHSQSEDYNAMQQILIDHMATMAKLVVRDGEGATKFITIRIKNSPSHAAAKHIASVIARSVLVKTGLYGKDPNWGGVQAALGYSLIGTEFEGQSIIDLDQTSISLATADSGTPVRGLDRGSPVAVDEAMLRGLMEQEDLEIIVDLRDNGSQTEQNGVEDAVYWTCDLSHEFVNLNGAFST